jgi:hypothetical protein
MGGQEAEDPSRTRSDRPGPSGAAELSGIPRAPTVVVGRTRRCLGCSGLATLVAPPASHGSIGISGCERTTSSSFTATESSRAQSRVRSRPTTTCSLLRSAPLRTRTTAHAAERDHSVFRRLCLRRPRSLLAPRDRLRRAPDALRGHGRPGGPHTARRAQWAGAAGVELRGAPGGAQQRERRMTSQPEYLVRKRASLQPGDVIPAGEWGRNVLGFGGRHFFFAREYVWERVRLADFPQLPSRIRSAFCYENRVDADAAYADHSLYTVYLADPAAPRHRADRKWTDDSTADACKSFEDMERCARGYWEGRSFDQQPAWEVLTEGGLTVVARIWPSVP